MSEYSKGPVVPTWYLAYEIQWLDTPATVESDKRTVWENVLLVEASDLEDAYAQAVDLGAQRQGGLLNEMRGFVQLTPEEDRKLDSIVRFVGLSKLVPLPSQPCDCLVFEWRAIEPDPTEVSPEDALPPVSELVATVEREARGVEWFAVELLFSAAETGAQAQPARFAKTLVLVSAPSPFAALTKANKCLASATQNWVPESEPVSWNLKGPSWIGTASDGVKHGSELVWREHEMTRDEVANLVKTKQQLVTTPRSTNDAREGKPGQ